MSRREKRLSKKQWISNEILQPTNTKNRLFRTYYRSNDPIKKQIYKKHLNEFPHKIFSQTALLRKCNQK